MREVTFFWKINRVEHLDIGLVVKIFRRIEFLSYVKRVPKDVRCLMKCHFVDGKGPEDISELYFVDFLETIVKPRCTRKAEPSTLSASKTCKGRLLS